jgi:hypothetical protein
MEAHSEPVEPNERDSTDEWRIAPARSPISIAELEGRIEVALATARSAEEAALEIGAASLEAAEQARRAAGLAEKASASAARAAASAQEASVRSIQSAPSLVTEAEAETSAAAPAPRVAPPAPDPTRPAPDVAPVAEVVAPAPDVAPVAEVAAPAARTPLDLPTAPSRNGSGPRRPDPFEDRIDAFRLRAERVMIRLQKIEAGTPPAAGPSEVVRLR